MTFPVDPRILKSSRCSIATFSEQADNLTDPIFESLNTYAHEWSTQFRFTLVGDCIHLSGGDPKWNPEGQPVDADLLFSAEEREHFRFLSALEAFVNHQHPIAPPSIHNLPNRRAYARRFIELCAEHLQRVADEATTDSPICVIPERYNEVVTVVTCRSGNIREAAQLRQSLRSDEEETRYEAAMAAGTYLVTEVIEELLACAFNDPCADVAVAASESLIELADPQTLPKMRTLWTQRANQPQHLVRMAGMLLAIAGEIDALIEGLAQPEAFDAELWIDLTVQLPSEEQVLPLVERLLEPAETSAELRWALSELLSRAAEPGFAFAAALIDSPNLTNRLVGCQALYARPATVYRDLLEKRLASDESYDVRYAAFTSLDQMADPAAFDALITALADSELFWDGSDYQNGGIQNFVRHNPQIDIRPMTTLFEQPDPHVRTRMLDSLELIQSGQQRLDAKPVVERALQDDDPEVRSTAIWISAVLNFADLRSDVQQIAWTDPDESVRDEAEQTLADWPD